MAVAVRPDRDPPANVAALLQPLGFPHRPAGDREGVVPQGLVAQAELLAEAQLEGEGRLTVVDRRLPAKLAVSGGRGATASVAALVSDFWLPASSSKDTRTWMAFPTSLSDGVYVELVAPEMSAPPAIRW